eukprot:jgi/Chlat1/6319/Chrsp44S00454
MRQEGDCAPTIVDSSEGLSSKAKLKLKQKQNVEATNKTEDAKQMSHEEREADAYKEQGNVAFANKQYEVACKHFTKAITIMPSNHILYSNRSAAYVSLRQYDDALKDARKAVELKPDWAKGYSRCAAAYFGLGEYAEATTTYERALRLEPNNDLTKAALQQAKNELEAAETAEKASGKHVFKRKRKASSQTGPGPPEKAADGDKMRPAAKKKGLLSFAEDEV